MMGTKKRANVARTSFGLLAMVWLSCTINCKLLAVAQPLPFPLTPDFMYGDLVASDPESFMLLNRLKQITEQKHRIVEQEHEITDEQMKIEALLEAKAMEQQHGQAADYPAEPELEAGPEALPVPAAIVHRGGHPHATSGKRKPTSPSYMSLCHFKICNMGLKRQSKIHPDQSVLQE